MRATLMICKRVHYRGMVQGVGFRMTTLRMAERFAVSGYVKNLNDGRVEVVVCGETQEVERFLGAVAARLADYIQAQDHRDEMPQSFDNFEIRM